jgi:hypothetical protein
MAANGYLLDCQTTIGTPFRLVAPPRFNSTIKPAVPERAPEFNENGDSILADIGLDIDPFSTSRSAASSHDGAAPT